MKLPKKNDRTELYDPKLIERIESLDFSNSQFVEVNSIVTKLRSQYSEYGRKALKPFTNIVERAVDIMLKKQAQENQDESILEEDEDDDYYNNGAGSDMNDDTTSTLETVQEKPTLSNNALNSSLANKYKEQNSNVKYSNDDFIPLKVSNNNDKQQQQQNGNLKRNRENNNQNNQNNNSTNGNTNGSTTTPNTPSRNVKKLKRDGTSSPTTVNGGVQSMNKIGVIPTIGFSNIGGIDGILREIREQIEFPMSHPEIYQHLGVDPPRGILLHGPPGCGKTLLANAIAGELKVPLISISAPEIASGMSGESEAKIRQLFQSAQEQAPCIVFIDEIDAIASKRENASKEMERRIVAQLLTCMDSLNLKSLGSNNDENNNNNSQQQEESVETEITNAIVANVNGNNNTTTTTKSKGHIIVMGATNRPESIDPALRMGGRFDKEIGLGVPDQAGRTKILQVITKNMRLAENFDYEEIASLTPGYVGADINLLAKEAATFSIVRVFNQITHQQTDNNENSNNNETTTTTTTTTTTLAVDILKDMKKPLTSGEMESLYIEMEDFKKACKKIQPSAKREGFATIPNVTWDDIGALSAIREELTKTILRPIKQPLQYKKMGIDSPAGVLMYGPPGCGKTLLAKAIANECQANFISVKGPELLNKYVGESERAVRQVFQRASVSAPCVIFFDEFDALAPKRGSEGSQATERVVNQLLTEMDGLEKRSEVFIVAATNRPDIIDGAMLRPGRLDKLLYVPLPTPDERVEILKTITSRIPKESDVDLSEIGKDIRCHAFSGADLSLLVKEAAMAALDRSFATANSKPCVSKQDFDYALSKTRPSVSKKDELMYDKLSLNIKQSRDQSKKPAAAVTPSNNNNLNNNSQPNLGNNTTQNNNNNNNQPMELN